jgi:hypothetical protein
MELRVQGQKLYIDFQRNFIHNYNDVSLFLIISKEKTKTVAGKDWCIGSYVRFTTLNVYCLKF